MNPVTTMPVATAAVKAFFVVCEMTAGIICLVAAWSLYEYFRTENKRLARFFVIGFGLVAMLNFLTMFYIVK